MKKFLILLAFVGVSAATMAQDETPTEQYSVATNSFWSNWFIQGNVAWSAFYGNQEKDAKFDGYSKSPLKGFRATPAFSVALGKWFTPGIGLRTKFSGIWGRSVFSENSDANKVKYWNLQEQALFNLSNLLYGYSETRTWNFIPYGGAGLVRNCTYNTYELAASVGVLNTWRLSNKWRLNLDLGYNICGDDFEGESSYGLYGGHANDNHDRWFTAEIGLTYNLGKATWSKTPDVAALKNLHQSQLDALNAQLADLQAENENLRNRAPEKEIVRDTTVVSQSFRDFITTPVSVFFDLNKINVANLKDLVNVQALAKYARENNSNLLVTGYADSSTGTPAINERLSLERANTVKNELIKMGIAPEKIRTTHNGGVDILGKKAPKEFDRRATVQIVED